MLVFEGTSGGLLTLLAYSAISDLAGVSTAVRVSTAVGPSQGVAMLAAEPFRCVVVDLAMPTALEFLEQVQEKPELREVPVLAYQSAQPDSASADRFAALRSAYPTLELLPSLDELRERITLHLSAARPGQVPAFVGNSVAAAESARRADEPVAGRAPRACAASTCSSSTTTLATSSRSPARSSCTASR